MPNEPTKSTWNEWAIFVLKTIEELKAQNVKSEDIVQKLAITIKVLETKITQRAATLGIITGAVTAIIVAVVIHFITNG